MSPYSTVYRTRERAIIEILANLYNADDEQLADIWFAAVGEKQLLNCRISDKNMDWDGEDYE